MQFTARIFTLAKDPQHPDEFQDAWRMDPAAGVAAVADGVSSAIFSGQWAELLVAAAVAGMPDPDDGPAFAQWLHSRRQEWSAAIDVGGLAWFQKAKLPLGAFSTLLWMRLSPCGAGLSPAATAGTAAPQTHRLRAFAIGDTCLLHVRDGRVLKTFPVQESPEFEADPLVLGSVDLKRDHLLKFAALDEPCCCGDLLVLCTDAVAEWGLRQSESQSTPDWASCWDLTETQWCEQIEALRQQGEMRYDDATLVLLRIGDEETLGEPRASAREDGDAPPSTSPIPGLTPGARQDEVAAPASTAASAEEPPVAPQLVEERPSEADSAAPILVEQSDWKEKLKALSEQVSKGIDQVSEQVLRGAKSVADKAAEVYRDQFGPRKKK